jgi:multidrug efflux pump subunit AcrA (membrane-fusion protein)
MAKQELRKRDDELLVAKTAEGQALTKFNGTKRLFDKGFVTKSELENDQVAADQARLKVEAAATARDLFIRYDFPKQAEEFLSKYDEALQGLIRARKEAVSKLAQAEARLRGAQGRYEREKLNLDELNEQLGKCVIAATTPGLVVYGGGSQRMYWGNQERIAVGAQVYERQAIITIPDPTAMGVTVGVHESHIKKVKKGLAVKITADAFPDDPITGEVTKVGVLPDSENRWMNPDMKLYKTTISIEGTREWVKPGMSAKIEILVKRLDDVVYVPLQAVATRDGKQVVFRPGRTQPVEVETGDFTDEFIEIRKGLAAGDSVLLRTPTENKSGEDKPADPAAKPAAEPAKATASR